MQGNGSNAALTALEAQVFDLVITDVDMGHDSLDGFKLVRELRSHGHTGTVCIHSNRIVAADHKLAIEAGAEAFLPKPIARAQLLRLVLQAVQSAPIPSIEPMVSAEILRQIAVAADAPSPRSEILIVDDNPFILDAWEEALRAEATVHLVASFEDLKDRLAGDPHLAGRLLLAVTDMHLDGSAGDGLDVGRLLKKSHPRLRVLLSTDGKIPASDLLGVVDMAIGKEPVELEALRSL